MENTERQGNMRGEFVEGATDGSYKKVVRDRGGQVESTTFQQRQDLADVWYGIHEQAVKQVGDGTSGSTPNYERTAPWRLT
jgi:hypothetical protein